MRADLGRGRTLQFNELRAVQVLIGLHVDVPRELEHANGSLLCVELYQGHKRVEVYRVLLLVDELLERC